MQKYLINISEHMQQFLYTNVRMCVNGAVHDVVIEPTMCCFSLQGSSSSRMSDVVLGPTNKPSGHETSIFYILF